MSWTREALAEYVGRTGKTANVQAGQGALDMPAPAQRQAPAPSVFARNDSATFARRALGRLPPGEMNKTEAAYAAHLECLRRDGTVLWFKFEAMTLKLAKLTTYRPDFAVMLADGSLEMHEVKGFWEDDARAKIKIAAAMFPFRFIAVKPKAKKHGGGYEVEVFE